MAAAWLAASSEVVRDPVINLVWIGHPGAAYLATDAAVRRTERPVSRKLGGTTGRVGGIGTYAGVTWTSSTDVSSSCAWATP
jgi:hypothetical protein